MLETVDEGRDRRGAASSHHEIYVLGSNAGLEERLRDLREDEIEVVADQLLELHPGDRDIDANTRSVEGNRGVVVLLSISARSNERPLMPSTDGPQLSARFEDALVYATQVHAGQARKGTDVPYVSHLLAVAGLVLEHGGTEDEAVAALLHDAIEDQPERTSLDDIAQRFGAEVARIVEGCSDTVTHPKPPWWERKKGYLRHLECADEAVLRVSCADKLHNVRTILTDLRIVGDDLWTRFNAGREDQLWYYLSLAEVFVRRFPSPLSDELQRGVHDLVREATA